MLKNLPVVDPTTLIRIGNTNECCVNSGTDSSGAAGEGNYALFATDTWHYLQKNAPEFEEIAAMQSGIGQIIARRDKTQRPLAPSPANSSPETTSAPLASSRRSGVSSPTPTTWKAHRSSPS